MTYITFDTSYLINSHFNFNNGFFRYIKDYIIEKKASLILSSIIDREIEKHLVDQTKNALNIINKAAKDVNCLVELGTFPSLIDENTAIESAKKAYQDLKDSLSIQIIGLSEVDCEKIFNDYFEENGAFTAKDKKEEFPDAFAIDSLIEFAKGNELLLLSSDQDWENHIRHRGGCSILDDEEQVKNCNLIISKSHEYILSHLSLTTGKDNKECKEYFDKEFDTLLLEQLESDFLAQLDSFRYSYYDINVTSYDILATNFNDALIIRKNDKTKKLSIAILYRIESFQDVNYNDYDNGCWDSEEKEYAFVPHVYSTIFYKTSGFAVVDCDYEYKKGKLVLKNAVLSGNEISLSDDDYQKEEEQEFDEPDYDYYEEMKLAQLEERDKNGD